MGTYTPNLNLYKPAYQESGNTWWSRINSNFDIIDSVQRSEQSVSSSLCIDVTAQSSPVLASNSGATNTANLKTIIAAAPDGSTLCFPQGKFYFAKDDSTDHAILINKRVNIKGIGWDPHDCTVTNEPFGIGTGTQTVFQLTRANEPVQAPGDPISVFVNGTPLTITTDFIVSPTGLVTFTTAPASGAILTWSGIYCWPARFMESASEFEEFMWNLYQGKMVSLRQKKI